MKNTIIILLLIAVLITAYFIMQDDDRTVATLSNAASVMKPGAQTQVPPPTVLSESDSPDVADVADVDEAVAPSSAAVAGKPLEPGIRDAVRELVNTSHEGLVEEKTDNGVVMKLNGRFRTAPVATVDENGEVTVRDYTSPPGE
ncbi:MAG: hypothetical protein RQ982_03785 [Gammaproteobacteria bacterium]|nr:hypothetical protein [Gammaproteobacteria bacterium]